MEHSRRSTKKRSRPSEQRYDILGEPLKPARIGNKKWREKRRAKKRASPGSYKISSKAIWYLVIVVAFVIGAGAIIMSSIVLDKQVKRNRSTGTRTVYVEDGASGNVTCSETRPCSFQGAIDRLSVQFGEDAVIQIKGTIDLGTDPHYDVFPAILNYERFRIQGERKNIHSDRVSVIGNHGPHDLWAAITLETGGLTVNAYQFFFVRNERSKKVYVVRSNTASTVSIVGQATDFLLNDDLTMWTTDSVLTWAGDFNLDVPFGSVTFDTVAVSPAASGRLITAEGADHKVHFRTGHVAASSDTGTLEGSYKLEAVYSPSVAGSTVRRFTSNMETNRCIDVSSLWLDASQINLSGDCIIRDVLATDAAQPSIDIDTGKLRSERLLIEDVSPTQSILVSETSVVEFVDTEVVATATGSGINIIDISGNSQVSISDIVMECSATASTGISVASSSTARVRNPEITGCSFSIQARENTQLNIVGTSLFNDFRTGAVRTRSGANLAWIMSGGAGTSRCQSSTAIVCADISTSSAIIQESTVGGLLIEVDSGGHFLQMQNNARVQSNIGGGGGPTTVGGNDLFFCSQSTTAWGTQNDHADGSTQNCELTVF